MNEGISLSSSRGETPGFLPLRTGNFVLPFFNVIDFVPLFQEKKKQFHFLGNWEKWSRLSPFLNEKNFNSFSLQEKESCNLLLRRTKLITHFCLWMKELSFSIGIRIIRRRHFFLNEKTKKIGYSFTECLCQFRREKGPFSLKLLINFK